VPLAARILESGGALVSQFPDGTAPQRGNFPKRNWTLAALADAVVVVEAAEGSGALITAEAALALSREVLAVPGSVFSPLSIGCHQLIRDGAALVQNARDVLAVLGQGGEVLDDALRPPGSLGISAPVGPDALLRHLGDSVPSEAGDLARRLQLPFPEVLRRLTALEMEGRVTRRGSGYVRLTPRRGRA
jgi:DNA processing protein